MCEKFDYLKAVESYALYWHKEAAVSNPAVIVPRKHPYRSIFECDRDRVMYCSAFRRLSAKTQVFHSRVADNLRTRLTHTLEVVQIARTIASQLGLDENLTEAIALGHDVGHTPFGHVGERTINVFSKGLDKKQINDSKVEIPREFYGFKHNLQSVRVLVEYSQNVKFSNFMLYGVREHSKKYWKEKEDVKFYEMYEPYCSCMINEELYPAWSFEAFIVKWADEVAQRHHDIEDAFLQKIMTPKDIVDKVNSLNSILRDENIDGKYTRLKNEAEKTESRLSAPEKYRFAHTLSSFLVDAYVTILIKEFRRVLKHFSNIYNIKTAEDFKEKYIAINVADIEKIMSLDDTKLYELDQRLGENLKYSILDSYEVQRMDGKGSYIIRRLVRAYLANPQQLPNDYVNRFIRIELRRSLKGKSMDSFMEKLKLQLGDRLAENVNMWKDYECREALRIIMSNDELYKVAYPALLRIVFDYIAGMTDSYATYQYKELYS